MVLPNGEEPRLVLCTGCGKAVREDDTYSRPEKRGYQTRMCTYCRRCASARGMTPGSKSLGPL